MSDVIDTGVADDAVETYQRDGATCLHGIFGDWVERLRDRYLERGHSDRSANTSPGRWDVR